MPRDGMETGVASNPVDELKSDPDHHAILARRDFLIALAMTSLAGAASCNRTELVRLNSTDGSAFGDEPLPVASPDGKSMSPAKNDTGVAASSDLKVEPDSTVDATAARVSDTLPDSVTRYADASPDRRDTAPDAEDFYTNNPCVGGCVECFCHGGCFSCASCS